MASRSEFGNVIVHEQNLFKITANTIQIINSFVKGQLLLHKSSMFGLLLELQVLQILGKNISHPPELECPQVVPSSIKISIKYVTSFPKIYFIALKKIRDYQTGAMGAWKTCNASFRFQNVIIQIIKI